jgi:hypothetical protein
MYQTHIWGLCIPGTGAMNRNLEKDHGSGSDSGKNDTAPAVPVPVQTPASQHWIAGSQFFDISNKNKSTKIDEIRNRF